MECIESAILIPARAGSKRIPNKNIVDLAGRPLIQYSIEESLKATGNVFVSTDCDQVKEICRNYKKNVIIIDRPPELCQDSSTTNSVIEHFLDNYNIETFALVQATSPLVNHLYLKKGFKKFAQCPEIDTIISTYKTVDFYWSSEGKPLNFDPTMKKRTQEIQEWHVENGAFYITNRDIFLKNNNLIGENVDFIVMPKIDSVDIDDYEDLQVAESTILYRQLKETK